MLTLTLPNSCAIWGTFLNFHFFIVKVSMQPHDLSRISSTIHNSHVATLDKVQTRKEKKKDENQPNKSLQASLSVALLSVP